MEEVNVYLLVIGNIVSESTIQWDSYAHVACAGNSEAIRADHIPDSVVAFGVRYILRDAIVMDAAGKDVNINGLFAPEGKSVFVSGLITTLGLFPEKEER